MIVLKIYSIILTFIVIVYNAINDIPKKKGSDLTIYIIAFIIYIPILIYLILS